MRSAIPSRLSRLAVVAVLGACGLALAAGAGASADRVVLTVTPRDALVDQPVAITASGLRPRSTVTLTAATRSEPGNLWTSRATFRADAKGRVIVARSPALSGSYRGRDGMGLFWSMRWGTADGLALPPSSTVTIEASSGGRRIAATSFTRRTASAGVTTATTTLANEGFVGCYYSSPATASRPGPAILMLGGSEGGLNCDVRPSLLASHGYPTLRLAYFRAGGLPQSLERIPLEYFETALRWLAAQPGVDRAKLVVFGISRGGECALLLGTVYPGLVHSVVSYVGSSVVVASYPDGDDASWTIAGTAVPYWSDPASYIPVEKIAGPIFLVGAGRDELWPSAVSVGEIVTRLKQHGRTDYTSLVYAQAGHLVGTAVPNLPLNSSYGGGSIDANAHARADSWPKLLAFLARLRSS